MKRYLFAVVLAGGMLAGIGCGGAYVSGYYANTAPPPLRAEVVGTAPGPGFVWIQGYWGWNNGRYDWVPGRWDRPPRGRNHWQAGRWEQHGQQYRYHPGRWAK